jgi:hypothetical protein
MKGQLFRGVIQVQGKDMRKQRSRAWAQAKPVTAADGQQLISELEAECTRDELKQRRSAFSKARRFIKLAAAQGGLTPEVQPISFRDAKRTICSARVDIEIRAGRAFVP